MLLEEHLKRNQILDIIDISSKEEALILNSLTFTIHSELSQRKPLHVSKGPLFF